MNETIKRSIMGVTLLGLFIFSFNSSWNFHIALYLTTLIFVLFTLREYIILVNRDEEGRPFTVALYLSVFVIITLAWIHVIVFDGEKTGLQTPFGIHLNQWRKLQLSYNLQFGCIFLVVVGIYARQIFFRPLMGATYSLGVTLLGLIYLGFFGSHLVLMMSMVGGAFLIWYMASVNFMTDTAAYFGGKFFGRHPVGFKVSPNKTYEGYITGLICATLAGGLSHFLYYSYSNEPQVMSLTEVFLFAPVLSVLAVIGDLIESAIKRDARMKDSSSSIPGHGGFFDLTDALYITVPAVYYYVHIRDFVLSATQSG